MKLLIGIILVFCQLTSFYGCSKQTLEIETARMQNIPASVEDCYYSLSDIRNPSHFQAKKLYNDYISSEGKFGLDPERYHANYKKIVSTDATNFYWRIYKLIHPGDVVIFDDNNDKMCKVFTNVVDERIFSPITYVTK